jgi:ComF family protein
MMNYLSYLREYLFPSGCGGCGEALQNPEDVHYGLCGACRVFLTYAQAIENRCEVCGKPLITEKETCLSCRAKGDNALVRQLTLFPYTGKFQSILAAYKFGKSLGVGNYFAKCLVTALEGFLPGEAAWVPVPPRPGKIKAQGWDQIEYLAGLLEKENKRGKRITPVCRCLKRLPSRTQKELNREERSRNLKGQILCVKRPPKIAVIFDDVFTTGATLSACAEALLEGGAAEVYGMCLFYD